MPGAPFQADSKSLKSINNRRSMPELNNTVLLRWLNPTTTQMQRGSDQNCPLIRAITGYPADTCANTDVSLASSGYTISPYSRTSTCISCAQGSPRRPAQVQRLFQ